MMTLDSSVKIVGELRLFCSNISKKEVKGVISSVYKINFIHRRYDAFYLFFTNITTKESQLPYDFYGTVQSHHVLYTTNILLNSKQHKICVYIHTHQDYLQTI